MVRNSLARLMVLAAVAIALVGIGPDRGCAQDASARGPSEGGATTGPAEEAADAVKQAAPESAEDRAAMIAELSQRLTGAALVGAFTMCSGTDEIKAALENGQAGLQAERYEIVQLVKLPAGDHWVITARIKYGDHDLVVPVPLQIKWAGRTPVITLDEVSIPGLGTFGARVVLHGDRYAGTWSHDEKGGHMFGVIELPAAAKSP